MTRLNQHHHVKQSLKDSSKNLSPKSKAVVNAYNSTDSQSSMFMQRANAAGKPPKSTLQERLNKDRFKRGKSAKIRVKTGLRRDRMSNFPNMYMNNQAESRNAALT